MKRSPAVAKSLLGGVPVVGSAFVETFALLFRSPLEQRADDWMRQMGERLQRIEQRMPGRVAALADDPVFLSVVTSTFHAAMRTHSADKRKMLANAVQVSGLGTAIDSDLQLTLIRFVDELTPTRVRHLKAVSIADAELEAVRSYPALLALCVRRTGIECSADEFALICGELVARSLLRISVSMEGFGDVIESDYLVPDGTAQPGSYVRVTDIGHALLKYINEEPAPIPQTTLALRPESRC